LIEKSYPEFHPKTINGCIWQLTNKFPDKVIKPSRGKFELLIVLNLSENEDSSIIINYD